MPDFMSKGKWRRASVMSRSGSFGQRPQVLLLCGFTLVRKPTSAKQDYVHHMVRLHWRSYSHPINLYPPPSPCYWFIVTNSSFWDPRQGAAYSQAIGVSAHPHPLSQAGAGELVPLLWPRRVVLQGHTQGGSPDFSEQVFFFQNRPPSKSQTMRTRFTMSLTRFTNHFPELAILIPHGQPRCLWRPSERSCISVCPCSWGLSTASDIWGFISQQKQRKTFITPANWAGAPTSSFFNLSRFSFLKRTSAKFSCTQPKIQLGIYTSNRVKNTWKELVSQRMGPFSLLRIILFHTGKNDVDNKNMWVYLRNKQKMN